MFEKTPIPFDLPHNSQRFFDLQDEISWGYVLGVETKQSPKFHRFSWSFGCDSSFESKFSGVFWVPPVRPVGKTGQTGLLVSEQPRSVRPVQAYQFCNFPDSLPICVGVFARSFEAFCVGLAFP